MYIPTRAARCANASAGMECGLSEQEAALVAETYDVVSLEKCFGTGLDGRRVKSTVGNFISTARQIKRQRGGDRTKVLFYWSSSAAFADCYEEATGGLILEHPEWWLRRDDGSVYFAGMPTRPYIDFTVSAAADWWVGVLTVVNWQAQGAMDGVFVDGAEDWMNDLPPSEFSQARLAKLKLAFRTALHRASAALHAVNPSALVIGNTALNSTLANLELLKDGTLDGICVEHFGAFEWADESGRPRAPVVLEVLDWLRTVAGLNKTVLVKGWVGPEETPVDSAGPTWPSNFTDPRTGGPLNRTAEGIARAAADLLDYSLAAYLCVAQPGFLFSYSWWYDVSQGFLPGQDAPKQWYPELVRSVGEAFGPAIITDGRHCTRSFQGADVKVDLLDYGSAQITWKPLDVVKG